ncbi:hypothetical protein DSECCO2_604490 [anaerobic digester metagenome]
MLDCAPEKDQTGYCKRKWSRVKGFKRSYICEMKYIPKNRNTGCGKSDACLGTVRCSKADKLLEEEKDSKNQ